MNGVLPSLCLLGAALGTANVFIMQRPTCHVQGMEGAVAGGDVRLSKTVVLNIAKAEPANAPFRPKQPVVPKDVDVTGSVEQTKKTDVEVVSTAKAGAPNAVVSAGENVTGSVKETKKTTPAESKLRNEPNQPGPHARHRPHRYGWSLGYWYPPPPAAFGMRAYRW